MFKEAKLNIIKMTPLECDFDYKIEFSCILKSPVEEKYLKTQHCKA